MEGTGDRAKEKEQGKGSGKEVGRGLRTWDEGKGEGVEIKNVTKSDQRWARQG